MALTVSYVPYWLDSGITVGPQQVDETVSHVSNVASDAHNVAHMALRLTQMQGAPPHTQSSGRWSNFDRLPPVLPPPCPGPAPGPSGGYSKSQFPAGLSTFGKNFAQERGNGSKNGFGIPPRRAFRGVQGRAIFSHFCQRAGCAQCIGGVRPRPPPWPVRRAGVGGSA